MVKIIYKTRVVEAKRYNNEWKYIHSVKLVQLILYKLYIFVIYYNKYIENCLIDIVGKN